MPKHLDYVRIWEKAPSSKSTMIKADKTIYARQVHAESQLLMQKYDDALVEDLTRKIALKLYDVKDVKEELEELTEDEDEANKQFKGEEKEVWEIKREIRVHIKTF